MNILITGSSGMIGSYFFNKLKKDNTVLGLYNNNFFEGNTKKIDITNFDQVLTLKDFNPNLIIHCAALTNIYFCESNPDIANKINVIGTKNITELSKKTNSTLVYISSDAVFSGNDGNYYESSLTNPQTIYGKTKVEGEKEVLKYQKSLVIRTNVFGPSGNKKNNFTTNILNTIKEGKTYNAFNDAIFCPVYLKKLLDVTLNLVNSNKFGTFHVVGSPINKFQFAQKLAQTFNYDTNLIKKNSVDSLPKNIKYPKNLSLFNSKIDNLNISLEEMLTTFKNEFKEV